MSHKCSGTEQTSWLRRRLLLIDARIVSRCPCIASISNKVLVHNNCQEAMVLWVQCVAYREKSISDGQRKCKDYSNFQFQYRDLWQEKTINFLFKWGYLSMDLFATDNWKNPCFFFQTYEQVVAHLCWQIGTLLLITAGKQSCSLIQRWWGSIDEQIAWFSV